MSSLVSEAKYRALECTEDYLEGLIFYSLQKPSLQQIMFGIYCKSVQSFTLNYPVDTKALQCKQLWFPLELWCPTLTLKLAEL